MDGKSPSFFTLLLSLLTRKKIQRRLMNKMSESTLTFQIRTIWRSKINVCSISCQQLTSWMLTTHQTWSSSPKVSSVQSGRSASASSPTSASSFSRSQTRRHPFTSQPSTPKFSLLNLRSTPVIQSSNWVASPMKRLFLLQCPRKITSYGWRPLTSWKAKQNAEGKTLRRNTRFKTMTG